MINPGDIILFGEVTKSKSDDDVGIKVVERNGKLWIVGVRMDGLLKRYVPIKPGDQILTVNGRNAVNASACSIDGAASLGVDEVSKIFREERCIELKLRRAKEGEYGDYSPHSSF